MLETENTENFENENPATEGEQEQFVNSFELISIIESLLFATDKPISLATFKSVFAGTTIDTKQIKKALEEMTSIYADPTRGVSLEEVTGGWQLRTKLDNMNFLKKIAKARPFRLSGPALEVLSIIAYKQPIIKHEIDQIRGVESGHLVRALMEKGLVSFGEKTDMPGKPMSYETTRKFLEIFGLRNLQELPTLSEIDQLLPDGIGEEEEKESLSDVTDMMSTALTSTYSEGEEELFDITEKIGSIDTSSEFFEQEKLRQKQKRDREKAEDIREALALGESVDAKDVKWLERYEAQAALAAAAQAAPVEETVVASEETVAVEEVPQIETAPVEEPSSEESETED